MLGLFNDEVNIQGQSDAINEEESSQSGYSVGLPIPGFDIDFKNSNKSSKKVKEQKR